MGGTAIFRHLYGPCFQLILSRKVPALAGSGSNDWGFTIVRRIDASVMGTDKPLFCYLAPVDVSDGKRDGTILTFAADSLPIAPQGEEPYLLERESGTLINKACASLSWTEAQS